MVDPNPRRRERSMTLRPLRLVALVGLVALQAPSAQAQSSAGRLVEAARRQLDELNPDSAALLLVRALDANASATVAVQVRGWTLFGIAELMRGNTQAARLAFRLALERDPSVQVDSLASLHSNLLREFSGERLTVGPRTVTTLPSLLVDVELPTDTTVPWQDGRLRLIARVSHRARVILTIASAETPSEAMIADTQVVTIQDGFSLGLRGRDGSHVTSGLFILRVSASDTLGQAAVPFQRMLLVSQVEVEPTPLPLPGAMLLSEWREALARIRRANELARATAPIRIQVREGFR